MAVSFGNLSIFMYDKKIIKREMEAENKKKIV